MVNTYHLIEEREIYFSKIKSSIAQDGILLVVDFKKEEIPVGPPTGIKLSPDEIESELRAAGFDSITVDVHSLDYQYILIAR